MAHRTGCPRRELDPREVSNTLFDSATNQTLTITKASSRTITEPFQGIRFRVVTAGGTLDVQAVVFRVRGPV